MMTIIPKEFEITNKMMNNFINERENVKLNELIFSEFCEQLGVHNDIGEEKANNYWNCSKVAHFALCGYDSITNPCFIDSIPTLKDFEKEKQMLGGCETLDTFPLNCYKNNSFMCVIVDFMVFQKKIEIEKVEFEAGEILQLKLHVLCALPNDGNYLQRVTDFFATA